MRAAKGAERILSYSIWYAGRNFRDPALFSEYEYRRKNFGICAIHVRFNVFFTIVMPLNYVKAQKMRGFSTSEIFCLHQAHHYQS